MTHLLIAPSRRSCRAARKLRAARRRWSSACRCGWTVALRQSISRGVEPSLHLGRHGAGDLTPGLRARFTLDRAQRHQRDGLDAQAAIGVAHLFVQRRAQLRAREIEHAKARQRAELDAPWIASERRAHGILQLLGVRLGAHRHKINGDQPAKIAQPDLTRGLVRRGDVEIERKALGIAAAARGRRRRRRSRPAPQWDRSSARRRRECGAVRAKRIFDRRVELGAHAAHRPAWPAQASSSTSWRSIGAAPRRHDRSRVQLNDRVLVARRFARDRDDDACALASAPRARACMPGAAVVAERQKAVLIA